MYPGRFSSVECKMAPQPWQGGSASTEEVGEEEEEEEQESIEEKEKEEEEKEEEVVVVIEGNEDENVGEHRLCKVDRGWLL